MCCDEADRNVCTSRSHPHVSRVLQVPAHAASHEVELGAGEGPSGAGG